MKSFNKVSTTVQQETDRKLGQQVSKTFVKSGIKYGVIKDVHDKNYAVTVLLDEGGMAASGVFLPVTNSWQELVHNFGNLRSGLLVEVSYDGDHELVGKVKVIGLEGETLASIQAQHEPDLSLYEIFSPGI